MSIVEIIIEMILKMLGWKEENEDEGNNGNEDEGNGNEEEDDKNGDEKESEPVMVVIDFNKLKGLEKIGELKYSVKNIEEGQIGGLENYKVWWRNDI